MIYLKINVQSELDVFTFFPIENAINCPSDNWLDLILSSLKMKHSVLILEEKMDSFPLWDPKKRWDTGDNWCWLAPRSQSVLIENCLGKGFSFQHIKKFLTSSK